MIPKMIFLLNKQINKQLTFRYDIAKGYVQGEEDIKCLIGQIAGHEKVYIVSKIALYLKSSICLDILPLCSINNKNIF